MASTGAVSTSAAIVTSRVISFQLEFVRPDGVTWGLLARTFDFVDQLLEKRLVRELFEQHYDDDVAYPNDVGIYSVESRMKEACGDEPPYQSAAPYFCAKVETTISTLEFSDLGALNSQNFMEFLMTNALKLYMENEEYPIVLQELKLTYLGPKWVSIDTIGLSLIGAIPGEMDRAAQGTFRRAVSDFINDAQQKILLGSDIAIRHQDFSLDNENDDPKQHVNPLYNKALQLQVTFFRKLLGDELDNTTAFGADQYSQAVSSRFQNYPEQFVRHYLSTDFNDDFFLNVHTVQTLVIEDSPTPVPSSTLSPTTIPQKTNPFDALYKEPAGSLNFKSLAVSVALLPFVILVTASILIYFLSRRGRTQKQHTIQDLEEATL